VTPAPRDSGRVAALLAGGGAALVVLVGLIRWIRPLLLLDPDPSWALPRLLLSLGVIAAAAGAGGAAAGVMLLYRRTRAVLAPRERLPLPAAALAGLSLAALVLGTLARFAFLDRLPAPLWLDDVSLIPASLELTGSLSDFADPIRPSPSGVAVPYGSVGVLYLEAYRLALLVAGTNVFGVRLLSALAGALSIGTAMLLARALLPSGGGTLAGLAVAGMRWHLILSRWGWNAIVVVPVLDLAALLLVRARRRASAASAAAAGLVAGLAAHIYLSTWVAVAAFLLYCLWPDGLAARLRLRLALCFAAVFLIAAAPLFLLRGPKGFSYFQRVGQRNVLKEVRRQKSLLPPLEAAADAIAAPWLLPDPSPWNDLPGKSRLGWLLGIPVAAALARAACRPREELSAFLLAHAGAAFVASVAWGTEMQPNGYRVAYLTTVTGVAAAGGVLALLALAPARARRPAAIAAIGLLVVSGAIAARDVFLRWGPSLEMSEGYQGRDNLLARAALRWEPFGRVALDPRLTRSLTNDSAYCFDLLVRYRLAANGEARPGGPDSLPPAGRARRHFRLAPPDAPLSPGERTVERVRDNLKEWAVVLGVRQ